MDHNPSALENIHITFLHLEPSPLLEARIREDLAKLERVDARLTHCRVSVARTEHRHAHGGSYEIVIDLGVPGGPIVIRHRSEPGVDAYVAVHGAFDVIRRRLDEHTRRLRGETKHHTD